MGLSPDTRSVAEATVPLNPFIECFALALSLYDGLLLGNRL
jgi:hypothetical protein